MVTIQLVGGGSKCSSDQRGYSRIEEAKPAARFMRMGRDEARRAMSVSAHVYTQPAQADVEIYGVDRGGHK